MSSWHESRREADRAEWLGLITVAIVLPVCFVGGLLLLNFLLEKLAEVFA